MATLTGSPTSGWAEHQHKERDMNWYLEVWRKYAVFQGRAERQEYWYFILFHILVTIGLMIIDGITGTLGAAGMGVLTTLYSLAIMIPGIAVAVRRLHDTDRTGWWVLLGFIPVIGGTILVVLLVFDGTRGENRYGPDPRDAIRVEY